MKKIYIIHENDEWLIPLRKSFKKINAPYVEWHMNKAKFDYKKTPLWFDHSDDGCNGVS